MISLLNLIFNATTNFKPFYNVKILYIVFILSTIVASRANAQTYVVGSGTETSSILPIAPDYAHSYSQFIYVKPELTAAGITNNTVVTKIRFNRAAYPAPGTNSANYLPNSDEWDVYLQNTQKTSFFKTNGTTPNNSWIQLGTMTKVFSGKVIVTPCYIEFVLTIPFNYTSNNLAVAIYEKKASYNAPTLNSRLFKVYQSIPSAGDSARGIIRYDDYDDITPTLTGLTFYTKYWSNSIPQIEITKGTPPPPASVSISSNSTCVDDLITFNASPSNSVNPTYQWQKNGTDIVGATSATYTPTAGTYSEGDKFTVLMTPDCRTPSNEIVIKPSPGKPVAPSPQEFCLSAIVSNLIPFTSVTIPINWYSASAGGSPLNSTTALNTQPYYVSQTVNGCESVARTEVSVVINPLPNQPVIVGHSGNVYSVTPVSGVTYTWTGPGTFPNGNTGSTVTFIPTSTGNLIVTPSNSCGDGISINFNNPLPVTLTRFSAKCDKNLVLNWSTASEQNSDRFVIEKSRDAQEWEVVDEVSAAGNSNTTRYYDFTDANSWNAISYYRLKQIDFNGEQEIYGPISVSCQGNENTMIVYPNPNRGSFTIEISSDAVYADTQLVLTDMTGKVIAFQQVNIAVGTTQIMLEDLELEMGTYLVSLQGVDQQSKTVNLTPVKVVVNR